MSDESTIDISLLTVQIFSMQNIQSCLREREREREREKKRERERKREREKDRERSRKQTILSYPKK